MRQLAKNTAHGVAAELAVAAYFDRRGNRLTAELANAVVFEKGDLNDHSTCGKPDFYFLDSETNKFIWIEVKFRSNLRNFNTFGEPEIKSELIDYVWKSSTVIKPDYLLVTNGTDLVSYNYHTRTQTKLDNFRESYALIISTALSRDVNQKKFNTYPEFD